jgi:hypothetical protein
MVNGEQLTDMLIIPRSQQIMWMFKREATAGY